MIWVDYTILAIIGISILISVLRGFTREALSLAGWIVAFWVAMTFGGNLARLLEHQIPVPSLRIMAAFAILFIVTLLLSALVNYLVIQLINKTGLSGTDRMLGVFFGLARGAVIVAVLVLLAGLTALPHDPWWRHSMFLHYFQDMAVWIRGYLPDDIAKNIKYG
jgi:membrane protein required for colicin V production